MRILLAEADQHIRRFVGGILKESGHVVVGCADAIEAAASLATCTIDIVVTDLVREFAEETAVGRICAARAIRMVTLSGSGFGAGAPAVHPSAALLEKPFRFGDLNKVLDAVSGTPESPWLTGARIGGGVYFAVEPRRP